MVTKCKLQGICSIPILCVSIKGSIDTMLRFEARVDVDANVTCKEGFTCGKQTNTHFVL